MNSPMPKFEPCACCGEPAEVGKWSRKIVSVVLSYCDRCGPRKTQRQGAHKAGPMLTATDIEQRWRDLPVKP